MPRFRVVEQRMYEVEYIIEAVDERAAEYLWGDIIEENGDSLNSHAYDVVSVEEVKE
jgi:hypothetical protein